MLETSNLLILNPIDLMMQRGKDMDMLADVLDVTQLANSIPGSG